MNNDRIDQNIKNFTNDTIIDNTHNNDSHDDELKSKSNQKLVSNIECLPVQIAIVVGYTYMPISDIANLGRGAFIQLNNKVKDPVTIYANGVALAKGEIVIDPDESVKILITHMADKDEPALYGR